MEWNDALGNWIFERTPMLLVCAIVLAIVGGCWAVQVSEREDTEWCTQTMQLAHTAHDSLEVTIACGTGDRSSVVPVVIPVTTP